LEIMDMFLLDVEASGADSDFFLFDLQ
jgi:hypothetical protein